MTTDDSGDPGRRSRAFRQTSAVVSGLIVIAVAGAFAVSAVPPLFDGSGKVASLLWPVGVILLTWAVLIRPCVRLVPHGVELHNIVRDVTVSWPAIDLVEARWALTVHTHDGKEFKSFACTAQRPKRGTPQTDGITGRVRIIGSLAPATMENLAHRPGSAGLVAERIRGLQEQYDLGVAAGHVEEVGVSAAVRPSYAGLVGVVGGALLVLVAFLL